MGILSKPGLYNFLKRLLPGKLTVFLRGLRVPLEIEYHLVEHCNLNCISCLHYSSIASPRSAELDEVNQTFERLSTKRKYIGILRLLGGEPLLNRDIKKIMPMARYYFPDSKIELVTNGILLLNEKVCDEEFWKIINQNNITLSVTIYPVKTNYERIKELSRFYNCNIELQGDRTGEDSFVAYRLTGNKLKHNQSKYVNCCNRRCLQLVGDRIYPCSVSAYVFHVNHRFNRNFTHEKKDYLEVRKLNLWRILRFQSIAKPFCSFCMPRSKGFRWKISESKENEWLVD